MEKKILIEVKYPTDDCPRCGFRMATVFTSAEQDKDFVWVNDGDEAVCNKCCHGGIVSVEDSECADVIWNDLNTN